MTLRICNTQNYQEKNIYLKMINICINQLEKLEAAKSAYLWLPYHTLPFLTFLLGPWYLALLGLPWPALAYLGLTWPYWALLGLT